MTQIEDIGYGAQFADFYDRIFPKDASADQAAAALSGLLGGRQPALEFGVGTGRIAIPLARAAQAPVIGVDSSPEMLERLRLDVDRTGARVEAAHGDMRTYTDERTFALVYAVCGTLSMVLDPEEQAETVRRAAALLQPGGHLVIETHNAPGILAMAGGNRHATFFVPYPQPNTGLLTSWMLDPDSARWQASHLWLEGGSFRIGSELSRLTTPDEVDTYATAAGLECARRMADWRGSPYSEQAPMFVAVYKKPERDR